MPYTSQTYRLLLCISFILLTGCQWIKTQDYNKAYGKPNIVAREDIHANPEIYQSARDIIDKRCVVCHACYDAPCQLKLNSLAGIDRGASKEKIYTKRIFTSDSSRLFEDSVNTRQWREKDFYPMLNERNQTPEANLQLSIMYRLLEQKSQYPLTPNHSLPDSIDISLKRGQSCPKIEEYDEYAKNYPLQGMPFGLPAISNTEFSTLKKWIELGASAPQMTPIDNIERNHIAHWETFFNQTTLQYRLVNRYIFEHLFLAHIYFKDDGSNTKFYKMVRSHTPTGSPIRVISSRRPFDSPNTDTFYYRLRKVESSTVVKTHMPYILDNRRYKFWQEIFFNEDFKIKKMPSYNNDISANPFKVFSDIPIYARYKFLLEEAQFSIMNFIKGPVCRGQVALDVINDDFWVVFTNPELHKNKLHDPFYKEHADLLRFPAYWGSQGTILGWHDLAKRSKNFIAVRSEYLNKITPTLNDTVESLIWDGNNGENPNASLTIFRHFDSATVLQGFAGTQPKTTWLIGYGLLERIHYLLVAGFDVNGTVQHQLITRLYMEFLRMEAEASLISLLPKSIQEETVRDWNTEPGSSVEEYFKALMDDGQGFELKIDYSEKEDDLTTLLNVLAKHTNTIKYPIKPQSLSASSIITLERIDKIKGIHASYFPEAAFLKVNHIQGHQWFTILRHSSHKNLNHLLSEKETRTPKNDRLNILPELLVAYPNRFIEIDESQINAFTLELSQAESQAEMDEAIKHFAVSRTSPKFWSFSDTLHKDAQKTFGLYYGIFDYNRLEKH